MSGDEPTQNADYEALRSVLRKLLDDDGIVYNAGGYLVAPYDDGVEATTRCIDLTPEEIAALKAALNDGAGDGN